MITEAAPAKVNLALHVVGQRADGYHLLQSLVTFCSVGDALTFTPAGIDSLALGGRFGSLLVADAGHAGGNLVTRARDLLRAHLGRRGLPAPAVAITLDKNLPLASGIGGGSADAAATLRGLNRLWNAGLSLGELAGIGLELGADVPMCVESQPLLAEGIGEILTPRPDLPAFGMVLVNPLVAVSTPAVFRALSSRTNPPLALPPAPSTRAIWMPLIRSWRNDLQGPAEAIEPEIGAVLHLIARTGAEVARMSGSGATCFGLYPGADEAAEAARTIGGLRPEWFVAAGLTESRPRSGFVEASVSRAPRPE